MSRRTVLARSELGVSSRRRRDDVPARYLRLQLCKLLDAVDDARGKAAEAGYPFTADHVAEIHAYVDEQLGAAS